VYARYFAAGDSFRNSPPLRNASPVANRLPSASSASPSQPWKAVLGMLAKFGERENYQLRYFEPTTPSLPTISMWSFDGKCTYLAAPYFPGTPVTNETLAMYDERANRWLDKYRNILWGQATDLSYSVVIEGRPA